MYEQIKQIYDALQDEESKIIFINRLLYSLTNDKKYLNKMIQYLIEKYHDSDPIYALLKWLKDRKGKKIIVFGAGFAGREIIEVLEVFRISVERICDNNTDIFGLERYGTQIISPDELKERYATDSIIIGTNIYGAEIYQQLSEMGFSKEQIFFCNGKWWIGNQRQYFDKEIMKPSKNEVFVDGGAFLGEDSFEFMKWCNNNYQKIYAFEPDYNNYIKMRENFSHIKMNSPIIYNKGLWSENCKLRFKGNILASSCVDIDGDILIEMDSIDSILAGERATFIKMDIEGCELEALHGAKKTICKYHPKLAVCIYHKPEDIVNILLYIKRLNKNYQFYLRHYSYIFTETVLYAVE